jgi:hypothetical protein
VCVGVCVGVCVIVLIFITVNVPFIVIKEQFHE